MTAYNHPFSYEYLLLWLMYRGCHYSFVRSTMTSLLLEAGRLRKSMALSLNWTLSLLISGRVKHTDLWFKDRNGWMVTMLRLIWCKEATITMQGTLICDCMTFVMRLYQCINKHNILHQKVQVITTYLAHVRYPSASISVRSPRYRDVLLASYIAVRLFSSVYGMCISDMGLVRI